MTVNTLGPLAISAILAIACSAPAAPGGAPTVSAAANEAATLTARPLQPVVFMAGFKAQANLPFVAVYVAQEKGYFRDEGLAVEIQHSSGQGQHVQLLGTGRIHFSTGSAADILKRVATAEVPLVAIAQIGQKGEQAFAVKAGSPIRSPKDWEGKLVGFKGTVSADYLAILRAASVDRSKVREVAVGFDPRVLVLGQIDVYPVFESNEPDTLARLGFPVRLFHPADFGVPSLGLALMTSREMVDTRADVVERFVRATMRGLDEAVRDRASAIDITMKYAPGEDPAHQRFMFDAEIAAAQNELTEAQGLGAISRERWSDLHDLLLELQVLPKAVDLTRVIDDRFIREARSAR